MALKDTIRNQLFYDAIRDLRGKLHDELPATTAASLLYHAVLMARDLDVPAIECQSLYYNCLDRIYGGYTPPDYLPAPLYADLK